MLEKNKDYLEMRVSSTDCAFTQTSAKISIEGFSYGSCWRLPDPGEPYVIISKEKFESLQRESEQLNGFVELYEKLEDKCKELESQIEEWKTTTKCKTPGEAKVVISTLTKAVIFNETNKNCSLDFEIKFDRGDEK